MDWKEFLKLGIDLTPLGMGEGDDNNRYYCTPQSAKIIGWAGVDGIHYCTIPKFKKMIFAVSPMNFGECVHPIARNFEDLLRLLLACGDMAALEQCHGWEKERFQAFLDENSITPEQQIVLNDIQKKCHLSPMDNPYEYIKALQGEFEYDRISYPKEYYDPDMNLNAPVKQEEWKVYFEGNFWNKGRKGERPGREIAIDKRFCWGNECWLIPAVYVCGKGLVVDFCAEIQPERMKAFMEKWNLPDVDGGNLSTELQERIDRENPLSIDFRPSARVNGKELMAQSGCAVSWIPQSCFPEGKRCGLEAQACLTHYNLDETRAWSFHRWAFPWSTATRPKVQSLQLNLKRELTPMEGIHFCASAAGKEICFFHPVTGMEHKLTVLAYEREKLSMQPQGYKRYELPTHYIAMTYKLEPDLPHRSFRVMDCQQSDSPRLKLPEADVEGTNCANSIGIIGGTDGPTAVILSDGKKEREHTHMALSSLHFEPRAEMEWRMVFYEKPVEDKEVILLP